MSQRQYPCIILKDGYIDGFSAVYFAYSLAGEVVYTHIRVAKSLPGAIHECSIMADYSGMPFYNEVQS